jgi:Zn-dependent protease
MGIASSLALILVVLKALGLISMAWGWCLAGFGVDLALIVVAVVGGYFFSKKVTKKLNKELKDWDFSTAHALGNEVNNRLNKAKDKLG